MAPVEVYFKASTAVISAAFGLLMLAGRARRPANQFLAFFLFLIAGNQFAETMRALATDVAGHVFWFRIASTFAFLDPFVLYYFASVFPERNRLNEPWKVGSVLAGSTLLLATTPWITPVVDWLDGIPPADPLSMIVLVTWVLFTAGVYGTVIVHVVSDLRAERNEASYRSLFPALCLAVVPAFARVWRAIQRVLRALGVTDVGTVLDKWLYEMIPALVVLVTVGVLVGLAKRSEHLPEDTRSALATGAWLGGGGLRAYTGRCVRQDARGPVLPGRVQDP